MRIINIDAGACTNCSAIEIGRRGEKEATAIVFDISSLVEEYGEGSAAFLVKRNGDAGAYPVVVLQEDDKVTWIVSNTDTDKLGAGECELWYYVDNTLVKTIVYPFFVCRDIGNSIPQPPEPYESLLEELTELTAETEENARAAAAAQAGAELAQATAEADATLAESWAIGGTGTRSGEDTDNAKYYAEMAAQGAEESGYAWFNVHQDDGEMYVYISDNLYEDVHFSVKTSDGTLEVTYE